MYLLNFKARAFFRGKSACVHGHACIGMAALRFFLTCTVSKMKRRQQMMLSFFPQPKSDEDKQVTVILGVRVNKYYV